MSLHEDLLRHVRKAVSARFHASGLRARILRQDTATTIRRCPCCHAELPRRVWGTPGRADLGGWVTSTPWPWPFEIEIKVGADKPNPNQESMAELCQMMGVPYFLCHSAAPPFFQQDADRCANEVLHAFLTARMGE